ncbi:MAG: hypothetical protein V1787_03570 [Candidatus Micrarchaeota archaeon]
MIKPTWIVVLVAALAMPAISFASAPIAIRIEMSTANIITGAAVPLKVIVLNVSNKPVNLPWPKYLSQFLTCESSIVNGGPVSSFRHGGLSLGHGKYPGGFIEPGKESIMEVEHTFPVEGRQKLKCILETSREGTLWWSFWEGRVESKPIRVKVQKGGG